MKIETIYNLLSHWTAEAETKLTSASFSKRSGISRWAVRSPDTDLKSIGPTCRLRSCFHSGRNGVMAPGSRGAGGEGGRGARQMEELLFVEQLMLFC